MSSPVNETEDALGLILLLGVVGILVFGVFKISSLLPRAGGSGAGSSGSSLQPATSQQQKFNNFVTDNLSPWKIFTTVMGGWAIDLANLFGQKPEAPLPVKYDPDLSDEAKEFANDPGIARFKNDLGLL